MNDWEKTIAWLAGIGALVAVGRALKSKEPLTWRIVLGRAILGGALSMVAGVLLVQWPDAPMPVLLGAAAGMGILGEQVLELVVRRVISFQFGRDE